jgi:hypothetical protein
MTVTSKESKESWSGSLKKFNHNYLNSAGGIGGGVFSGLDTTASNTAFTDNIANAAGGGGTGGAIHHVGAWIDNGGNTFSGNSPDDVSP